MLEKILETVNFIKSRTNNFIPEIGIVLGTGLGRLVNDINIQYSIPYKDIPNFPIPTVKGHRGNLIFGMLSDRKIIAMQGRFHYYEGYSTQEITFPIRVMKYLGIKMLMLSNASGGINPDFNIEDIMFITDHISLFPNPLIGKNDDRIGIRFPDMSNAYDKDILELADKVAKDLNIKVQHGVYVGYTGPAFETLSEYQYYKIIGGDAVGMSTVPEVIVARHCGLPVFAMSIISDIKCKELYGKVTHEKVLESAGKTEPKMALIIKEILKRIDELKL